MTIRFDELDDAALILDIEKSFGIAISDEESSQCFTFGDLFDIVARRAPHAPRGGCLSANAFWALRRSLAASTPAGVRIRPSTRLSELSPNFDWRRWRREIERDNSLSLPAATASPSLGPFLAGASLVCGLILGALGMSWILAGIGLFGVGAALFSGRRAERRRTRDMTLADVVRLMAPRNLGRLATPAHPIRTADLWCALEALTREHAECFGPIDKRTRLEHV